MDCCPGDTVGFRQLAEALPMLAITEDSFAIQIKRPASDMPPLQTCAPHAGAYPLDY